MVDSQQNLENEKQENTLYLTIEKTIYNILNSSYVRSMLESNKEFKDNFEQLFSYLYFLKPSYLNVQNLITVYVNFLEKEISLNQYENVSEENIIDLNNYILIYIKNTFKVDKELMQLPTSEEKINKLLEESKSWSKNTAYLNQTPNSNIPNSQKVNTYQQYTNQAINPAIVNFYPYDSKPEIVVKGKKILTAVIIITAVVLAIAWIIQILFNYEIINFIGTDDKINPDKVSIDKIHSSLIVKGVIDIALYCGLFALCAWSIYPKKKETDRIKYNFSRLFGVIFIIWSLYLIYIICNSIINNYHLTKDYKNSLSNFSSVYTTLTTIFWSFSALTVLACILGSIFLMSKNPKPDPSKFSQLMENNYPGKSSRDNNSDSSNLNNNNNNDDVNS